MSRALFIFGIISLVIFTFSSALAAPQDESHTHGLGVLICPVKEKGVYSAECFETGPEGVSGPVFLYAQPEKSALVTGEFFSPSIVWTDENKTRFKPVKKDETLFRTIDVGYDQEGIVIYERKEGWMKSSAGWFQTQDVALDKGMTYMEWEKILEGQISEPGEHGPWRAEFFPIANQILYDAPDGTPLGSHWSVEDEENGVPDILVLEEKGPWIKVIVDKAQTSCGNGEKPEGPTGWIRMTDTEGYPLVHWNTSGC